MLWPQAADDHDIFRINPIQYATEKSIPEDEALDLFLYGTKFGLFEMDWHMVCAFCGHIVKSLQELTKLHSHFDCDFCGAENHAVMDDYIHVSFTISRQIRAISFHDPDGLSVEDFYQRYQFAKGVLFPGNHDLGEVVDLLTLSMTYVPPHETMVLERTLDPGSIQIKDLKNQEAVTFFLDEAEGSSAVVSIQLEDGKFLSHGERPPRQTFEFPVAPFHIQVAGHVPCGPVRIEFTNAMDTRSPLWVMYFPAGFESDYVQFESFLSATGSAT